ncbi:hypothetical protein GCM10007276_02940 [Agaricicola taiwanensis]|uniref:Ankyrin repeat domain-containing protein n=1 Tax=Agaricicola taiwanensis TaxID=591372 RepID=A0A8J2VM07_9RHOB|nr:ankyrin repeat domain-containing protein [Agaricicola taiwanensis]GGE29193.1 hypothetical protein GCM10007276_02940 [Agaricicola taiwanensis]
MVAALRRQAFVPLSGEDGLEGLFGLQIKASTDRQGTAAEIQLRDALKSGNMQLAVQIINSGTVDINWVDSQNGWSFLHYAVSTDGGLPAIEHLVKAGIDIRLTNDDGETAIEMFDTRYFAVLQENGYDLEYIKFATGAAKWISDKATEEIKKIAEGGMDKVGDFMEVNKWRAAGGSLIPIMTKVSLFDVLHLRPEDQVWFVKDILGNDGRVEEMIENGEIDPEALMAEELNGETPYVFFQRMADNEEIAEADRTRFQEIADVLKGKNAPGSEPKPKPKPTPEENGWVAGPLGPDTQIPKDDHRTAEEIARDSKVYSQLHEKDRKDLLEFIGKDVKDERRKVYLAVAVLNHIEHYNENGDAISPTGEGVIDGWTRADRNDSKSEAVHGTEAGRFQDFLKYGWGNLKGDSLPNGLPPKFGPPPEHLTPSDTDKYRPEIGPLGPDVEIPDIDKRTAQEIAEDSLVFSQLHEKDRKALLEFIGKDVKDERKKIYLAVAVLNHIEHFDEDGEVISRFTDERGNGKIDGWTRGDRTDDQSHAQHGTESGRFQDFLKYGWGNLKGDSQPNGMPPDHEAPEGPPPATPEEAEAQRLVREFPLLANLAPNDKAALKSRVGDFDKDPAAARIAIEVLNHIERYDEQGKPIVGGGTIGNGKIDGWTRADRNDPQSHAQHGTEAGRFQDFIKYGWSSLKTETDAGAIADIEDLENLADGVGDDFGKFEDFMNQLQESVYYGIISEAGLPADKSDFIANPDAYSTEERAAAALELMIMRERIGDGIQHYSEYGVVHGTNHYGRGKITLHTDPQKVMAEIDKVIGKLINDDVSAFISEREMEELQEITGKSSKLKEFLGDKVDAMRDDAWGLDKMIEKADIGDKIDRFRDLSKKLEELDDSDTEERERLEGELKAVLLEMEGPLMGALGAYMDLAITANVGAGENKNLYDDMLAIDPADSKYFDLITASYDALVADPHALTKLVESGLTQEEAIFQLNGRASIFASYGSDPREMSEHINANIQSYTFQNTNADELVGIILKEDGSLDEERLTEVIDKIRQEDPDSPLINGDNAGLSTAQIITGLRNVWDTFRGTGKLDFSLKKFEEWANDPKYADRRKEFLKYAKWRPLSDDASLHKTFAAGAMHLFSGVLAASAMIAKGAAGDIEPADIVSALGSGLQTIGLSGEAWTWSVRGEEGNAKLTDKWNKTRENWRYHRGNYPLDPNAVYPDDHPKAGQPDYSKRPWTEDLVKRRVENFKHFARFVGATGGGLILGASIYLGMQLLNEGEEELAAVTFAAGAANASTLIPSYLQSMVPMFTDASGGIPRLGWDKAKVGRIIGRIGVIGGGLMMTLNVAAFFALFAVTAWLGIKEDMETEDYFASFTPTLAEYGIDGGYDSWWDEDDGPTNGS